MITFGLALPHYDGLFPDPDISGKDRTLAALEYAQRAEAAGFHRLWVSDHLWLQLDDGPRRRSPDCWTLLAAVASATHTVRIGSLVTPASLRPPTLLTHQVATVLDIAGPRVDVGLGAGWHKAEFTEAGRSFLPATARLAAIESTATHLRAALGPDAPPIWVGGKRAGLLGVAGTVADGWNLAWDPSPAEYTRRLDALVKLRVPDETAVGFTRSVGLTTIIGIDEKDLRHQWRRLCRWAPGSYLETLGFEGWRAKGLVGTPDEVRAKVTAWKDVGVDDIVCALGIPFGLFDVNQMQLKGAVGLGER